MKSKLTRQFRLLYRDLPLSIQKIAVDSYHLWRDNPKHPGLHFKPVEPKRLRVWSVRINADYRALALVEGGTATWFWIGTHKDYDRILRGLRDVRKGKF